jgi:hypothetical protein
MHCAHDLCYHGVPPTHQVALYLTCNSPPFTSCDSYVPWTYTLHAGRRTTGASSVGGGSYTASGSGLPDEEEAGPSNGRPAGFRDPEIRLPEGMGEWMSLAPEQASGVHGHQRDVPTSQQGILTVPHGILLSCTCAACMAYS